MENNLGEIFFDGKIINLKNANIVELDKIVKNLRNSQLMSKAKIDTCLNKMKNA